MKNEYKAPAIEVLNVEDTEHNYFFNGAIVVEDNCGGWGSASNFKVTSPTLCTCPIDS